MHPKLQIEYNQQGYYGLLDGEPLISHQQHVIYTPNASLIRLLYEESCELKDLNHNPENGVIFRLISRAIDSYRNKTSSSPIKSLLEKDYYLQIQSKLSHKQSADLFPIITDIFDSNGLEQARLDKLNSKHWKWITEQVKGTDYWERSFILEMAQNGYLLLSLVFLNNHLTLPLYAEYCLLSRGSGLKSARENYQHFIKSHTKEFTYLRLLYNK